MELYEVKRTATQEEHYYLSRWSGEIWYLKDTSDQTEDAEFFSQRPQTPGVGGQLENWPEEYEVRVGNLDGGDSLVIEYKHEGEVWVRNENEPEFWRMEVKGEV
jgi:hypothetical protein